MKGFDKDDLKNADNLSRGTKAIITKLKSEGKNAKQIKTHLAEKRKGRPPSVGSIRAYLSGEARKKAKKSKGKKGSGVGGKKIKLKHKGKRRLEASCPPGTELSVKQNKDGTLTASCTLKA